MNQVQSLGATTFTHRMWLWVYRWFGWNASVLDYWMPAAVYSVCILNEPIGSWQSLCP